MKLRNTKPMGVFVYCFFLRENNLDTCVNNTFHRQENENNSIPRILLKMQQKCFLKHLAVHRVKYLRTTYQKYIFALYHFVLMDGQFRFSCPDKNISAVAANQYRVSHFYQPINKQKYFLCLRWSQPVLIYLLKTF